MSERLIYDDIDGKSHDVTDLVHALGYVRVVRCKDCKWRGIVGCCALDIVVEDDKPNDDDYCSYGERKEQEHE